MVGLASVGVKERECFEGEGSLRVGSRECEVNVKVELSQRVEEVRIWEN